MKQLMMTVILTVSMFSGFTSLAQGRGRGQGKAVKPEQAQAAEAKAGTIAADAEKAAERAGVKREKATQRAQEQAGKQAGKADELRGKAETVEAQGRPAKIGDKGGRGAAKRAEAKARVLGKAEGVHLKRVARLEAIREKMLEKGNDEAAARASALLEQEKTRYERHVQKLSEKEDSSAAELQGSEQGSQAENKDEGR